MLGGATSAAQTLGYLKLCQMRQLTELQLYSDTLHIILCRMGDMQLKQF